MPVHSRIRGTESNANTAARIKRSKKKCGSCGMYQSWIKPSRAKVKSRLVTNTPAESDKIERRMSVASCCSGGAMIGSMKVNQARTNVDLNWAQRSCLKNMRFK
jgi:hypothetical protein